MRQVIPNGTAVLKCLIFVSGKKKEKEKEKKEKKEKDHKSKQKKKKKKKKKSKQHGKYNISILNKQNRSIFLALDIKTCFSTI